MPTEPTDDGSLVYGYLNTAAPRRGRAGDAVVVNSPGTAYEAELRPYRFGPLSACEITGDQDVLVRPWRPGGENRLVAGVLLDGDARLEQNGRETSAGPGGFLLYTGDRPFRLGIRGPYRYFVVDFEGSPLSLAQAVVRQVIANGQVAQAPAARIFAATLAEFADQAAHLDPATGRELGEHVVCLLRTVLRSAPRAEANSDGLFARVLDYVEAHLGDDLGPGAIAAAHHISVRYLHKLFHDAGDTVGGYIRRRRLDRIRGQLADPGQARRSVASLAAEWGIAEASHFSKLFRAEFGVSPREYREAALGGSSPSRVADRMS
ncbi:AraC-type DNA-binding protein [Amycolatopsis tolypomycina]|uniref:AraC-type DNA-binding protein n=1 Tax=Amycolatopsis tolypomycina TaxID=208445 RepID=A0A1H4TKC1_9PSEU|nr:helix-turn-helix domain-containing protein [Amycolatopsis tolypomycina]SEC56514.1 AraC-type DNA-binding protein [Amycolatopsis tolypomycina]